MYEHTSMKKVLHVLYFKIFFLQIYRSQMNNIKHIQYLFKMGMKI